MLVHQCGWQKIFNYIWWQSIFIIFRFLSSLFFHHSEQFILWSVEEKTKFWLKFFSWENSLLLRSQNAVSRNKFSKQIKNDDNIFQIFGTSKFAVRWKSWASGKTDNSKLENKLDVRGKVADVWMLERW